MLLTRVMINQHIIGDMISHNILSINSLLNFEPAEDHSTQHNDKTTYLIVDNTVSVSLHAVTIHVHSLSLRQYIIRCVS